MLIAQAHSPEDDLAFIQVLNKRFVIDDILESTADHCSSIYKPSLLPDPEASAQRWRDYCARNNLGGLCCVAVQASETEDPRPLGFDASVEFPPHELAVGAPVLNGQMKIVNPNYQGVICDYSYLIESAKKISRADFTLFRGVCPSWDNEARKPGKGMTSRIQPLHCIRNG